MRETAILQTLRGLCTGDGIGRLARMRVWCSVMGVRVQVPLGALKSTDLNYAEHCVGLVLHNARGCSQDG